jgi:hypothetical protein
MEEQIEINEVLKYLREQIADQAQQIAILKATLAMKENPTT